ncbi:MAG: GNAT family N-acetyltransferase, partial [Ilumatobacteraceae bacterium]
MSRTRSEYRLQLTAPPTAGQAPLAIRPVSLDDRAAAARLMLAAYRGTIDDEGEGEADALDAIDDYFSRILWPHSFVMTDAEAVVAMVFVVVVDDRHYIDPVATDAAHKGRGLGSRMVVESLCSLAAAGVDDVGATIT